MENQHSKNIAMIVFCLLFLYACTETGTSKQTPTSSISAKTTHEKSGTEKEDTSQVLAQLKKKDISQKTEVTSESDSAIEVQNSKVDKSKYTTPKPKTKPKKKKKKLYPKIVFENEVYDFGEITEGDTINYNFKFTNSGKKALDIKSASATCGCTQPSYPFIGVEPGEEGTISVRYISVGKSGPQEATITIKSNADFPTKKLLLKGIVKDKIVEKEVKMDSTEVEIKN